MGPARSLRPYCMGLLCGWSLALLAPLIAVAQPSLDQEDARIVVIDSDTGRATFQLFRDGRRPHQFYYTPNRVRLTEREIEGEQVPNFTLVAYAFGDENSEDIRGGILQFQAVIGATYEEIEGLKEVIPEEYDLEEDESFGLAAIPIKSAQVAIYAPDGDLITSSFGTGAAPNDATQTMVFQIDLKEAGFNVYRALTVDSAGGVPVVFTMDYLGITPAAEVTIKANYELIANHYSTDEETKWAAAASGFWGAVTANATAQSDYERVRDTLKTDGALEIEFWGTETYSSKQLNDLVAPILDRINKQILTLQTPPEEIDPAVAAEPQANASAGRWGMAAAWAKSTAVKDVSEYRGMTEEINMTFRDTVSSKTTVSGLIGVNHYPDEVKKKVFVKAHNEFVTGILNLPLLSKSDFSLAECDAWVTAPGLSAQFYRKTFDWTPDAGWVTAQGNEVSFGIFNFTSLPADLRNIDWKDLRIHYNLRVETKTRQNLRTAAEFVPLDGAIRVAGIDPDTHPWLEIDLSELWWKAGLRAEPEEISSVRLIVTQNGRSIINSTVRPIQSANRRELYPPDPIRFYYELASGPVAMRAIAKYLNDEGEFEDRLHSNNDLTGGGSLTLTLDDFERASQ